MQELQPYVNYGLCFAGAFLVALFSIPNIIFVAKRRRLFDVPDNHRKIHTRIVPNLGGVGIFFAYIIITSLAINPAEFPAWNYLAAASLVLFVTGLKDDLVNISPSKKFFAQFIAAFIIAYVADVRLHSLYGLLGIYLMPGWLSVGFTVIGCMFVTNAFNLIDGIDGLAGSVGLLAALALGMGMAMAENVSAAIIAFGLAGAILGFLRFNISPARIFMGDTGAMLIGFVLSVLSIMFVNTYEGRTVVPNIVVHSPRSGGALIIALSALFMPIFDTFRVFTTRLLKGYSPFRADRTHLHHYLLDLGFSHTSTVTALVTANVFLLITSIFVQDMNVHVGVAILLSVAFGLFAIVFFMRRARVAAQLAAERDDLPLAPLPLPLTAMTSTAAEIDNMLQERQMGARSRELNPITLTANGVRLRLDSAAGLAVQEVE